MEADRESLRRKLVLLASVFVNHADKGLTLRGEECTMLAQVLLAASDETGTAETVGGTA